MSGFRTAFGKISRSLNWYPKHMNTGLKQMQAKLRSVDCILELHDARIPFSGRNPNFSHNLVGDKPHIIILNKSDLITNDAMKKIQETYEKTACPNIVFTNCKNDQDLGIRKLVPLMKNLIEKSDRYHRTGAKEYHAMIIGIPNVGKSSLINMLRSKYLRKGRALKVGPSAGVTKCVHEKVRVSESPLIFLFDTPGILTPKIGDNSTGIKLALCGNLPDHNVGQMLIADFVLFTMNQIKNYKYMDFFGVTEPCDCITTVLTKGSIHLNLISKTRSPVTNEYQQKPNFDLLAKLFIDEFRSGGFGKIVLDEIEAGPEYEKAFHNFDLLPNEKFISSSSRSSGVA